MNKAFSHKEKCGCEYCNSGRKMQFALVKIEDKFNFISVYEVDALNSDKLIYKTEDVDEILNTEKENKFSVFYGGIIYYSPDNSIKDKIITEVEKCKGHIFLHFDKFEGRYLGFVNIKLFPEEIVETKSTIKLIPCIAKMILTKSAKKLLKKQKYIISSIKKKYIDSDTNEETIDIPASIIISNREFGLVITSEKIKKNKKNLAYIADKDKLKEIYNQLGIIQKK
ncbi:hypothetical protein HMPREF9093_01711 [Fusobacterium sp. oral taxon 370 str. F0437]|uniref:hypothetical protein n=1 Tax=Fusobacterium sp. oral taxon 370 TaxID=712288 RepID=UPI000234AB0F|nr:hypothetical protein [Fusobacterium sp. oral taxon 370]EHI77884.1 hypothetical protein HMPREF9093_01711 [Fusobacterium sp. oral taxon 370 str. F0437]